MQQKSPRLIKTGTFHIKCFFENLFNLYQHAQRLFQQAFQGLQES